jgi:hypothetical protein
MRRQIALGYAALQNSRWQEADDLHSDGLLPRRMIR